MTFVEIESTIGLPMETTYDELTWFEVDYENKFPLMDLSAASIARLAEFLDNDNDMLRAYQFSRIGFNYEDDTQLEYGLNTLKKAALINDDATVDDVFIKRPQDFVVSKCLMLSSQYEKELQDCIDAGKAEYETPE